MRMKIFYFNSREKRAKTRLYLTSAFIAKALSRANIENSCET